MRRLAWIAIFAAPLCGARCDSTPPPPPGATFTAAGGAISVDVQTAPFSLVVHDAQGNVLLESAPPQPGTAYAPIAITHDTDETTSTLVTGFDYFQGQDDPWTPVGPVQSITNDGTTMTVVLGTPLPNVPTVTLTLATDAPGLHVTATANAVDDSINRVAMSWVLHDDDHFFGTGERFVGADQRGQYRYMWVEDRFGSEDATLTESSPPSPKQAEEAYIPIPWLMDPRGFGMLQHGTFRTVYHLGDEVPNAWSVQSWTSNIDFTLYADQDPKNLVADLTTVTGRPPDVPDWILAPRRRANIPVDDEITRLRSAHIPTTMIDTALHYLPSGIGTTDAKSITADIHARGFKAIAYFCSFIDQNYHPVFDDAVANGYLIKHADGTPYIVFDIPRYAGIVDFTNPAAVTWYQGLLKQAIDDGWDGWMYDFAEYVPDDAVMFNGMTGMEAHDLYPVLYQKAAHDLLEQLKPKDYLFFVRSGFAGTGGNVPMVWGGDQDTDFSEGKGMPSGLTAALNAGMSGIPLWGSDISGYHYLYNPPPDEELYLRWTELGALSPDMHDENEGSGNQPASARWQIWNDQFSQDTYRKYAGLHTQLIPYLRVALNEARATGLPIMRHLYLYYPHDPNVWNLTDEYMLGDSLLAAPIVARGAQGTGEASRSVYLPEAAYYDFFSGARVAGGGTITANATLDQVPLYARVGAIVPMLSPDVETLMPATDGSGVVSIADRSDVLDVEIFSGGSTDVTLGDGTTIAQSAPADAYDVTLPPTAKNATLVQAAQASDLTTCDACWLDDETTRTLSITLKTSSDVITAGPVSVTLDHRASGADPVRRPNVKRFVMRVHH